MDDQYLVAHPSDDRVLVLTALVGWVWQSLGNGDWSDVVSRAELDYPNIGENERNVVLQQILELLRDHGLVE